MSGANGYTNGSALTNSESVAGETQRVQPPAIVSSGISPLSPEQIRHFCAELETPFDSKVIDWRVTNTSKCGSLRGQVIPYADQRAYIDRLNRLFTPAGWTRKYSVHTSAHFERSKDQKTVAKVFVTCELSIDGLGRHSATGEGWTDDENAITSAEAQAFKRSCACFGLGRYLYYFEGVWVDLDDRKRPKTLPRLPQWATAEGWQNGQRPDAATGRANETQIHGVSPANASAPAVHKTPDQAGTTALVRQIEALGGPLGKGLYRGVLKTVAGVWNPAQIQDPRLLERVLTHMHAAERGLRRLDAILDITGADVFGLVLDSLRVPSLNKVDNLETLKQIVLKMEELASRQPR